MVETFEKGQKVFFLTKEHILRETEVKLIGTKFIHLTMPGASKVCKNTLCSEPYNGAGIVLFSSVREYELWLAKVRFAKLITSFTRKNLERMSEYNLRIFCDAYHEVS